jgi:hypothetical protein
MYAVIAKDQFGNDFVSRYFQTIRAARRWKKWLLSREMPFKGIWIQNQVGGMEVK